MNAVHDYVLEAIVRPDEGEGPEPERRTRVKARARSRQHAVRVALEKVWAKHHLVTEFLTIERC